LLDYLDENAASGYHREHVTSLIPEQIKAGAFPSKFKISSSKEQIDLSDVKTSIDTAEEYDRAVMEFNDRKEKQIAALRFGQVF